MISLGCQTYLKVKAGGDNSMSEKAGRSETVKLRAGRGPDGMVKPGLVEPKWPHRRLHGSDTTVDIRGPHEPSIGESSRHETNGRFSHSSHAPGGLGRIDDLKDTKWAPTAVLDVNCVRNAGSPTGREAYGDGDPVVVGAGESPVHGEGGQVRRMKRLGGPRDA